MKKITLLIAFFILATPFVSGNIKRQHEIKEGSGWGRILNNDRQFKNVDRHPKFVTSNRYEKIHIGNKVCIAKKGSMGLPFHQPKYPSDTSDKSYASLLFYYITELGDTSMQFIEEVFQPIEEGASATSLMNMRNPTLLSDTNNNLYLYYSDGNGMLKIGNGLLKKIFILNILIQFPMMQRIILLFLRWIKIIIYG